MYPTTYLQPGSSNKSGVKKLQDYLVKQGYMTRAQVNTGYGIYGPQTRRAVSSLQKKYGVDTSGGGAGYFGPKTIKALGSTGGLTYSPTTVGPNRQSIASPSQTQTQAQVPTALTNFNKQMVQAQPQVQAQAQAPTATTSKFTYLSGPVGTPHTLDVSNLNGVKSTTGVVPFGVLNNKAFRNMYTGVTPEQAVALKEKGINIGQWNGTVSNRGINNMGVKNTLASAMRTYNAKHQQQAQTANKYTVSKGDTLNAIADKHGTSVGALMQANPNITNPNLIYTGSILNLPQYTDTTSSPITADTQSQYTPPTQPIASKANITVPIHESLNAPTKMKVLPSPTSTTPTPIDTTNVDTAKTDVTQAQTAQSGTLSKIQALIDKQGGMSAERNRLAQQKNIPELQQQLNEINTQMRDLTTNAEQAKLRAEDRHAPMFQIRGEQASIDRQLSMKTLGLSAMSQALQGNISLANTEVDKALSAEFDPIKSQIGYYNTMLSINRDNLSRAQKREADAISQQLQERNNTIKQQQSDKAQIYKTMLASAQNKNNFTPTSEYPTLSTALQAIVDSSTPDEAILKAVNSGLIDSSSAPASSGFSLSAGQTRYDSKGNVIARAPAKVSTKSGVSTSQLKMFINKQIATKDFQELSPEDKKRYIRSQGADPYNFGF